MMKKETYNLKILSELKTDLVNKAGIGWVSFQELNQRHKHIYIYMRLIGLAVIEGSLQTHKYRFGIQPNNFKDRVREIEWKKLI